MKIVMKFGGTSVGTSENIRHVADLVIKNAQKDNVTVVVSALAGVTNSLIEVAELAKKSDEKHIQTFTKELLNKHLETISTAINSKQLQKEVTETIEKTIAELEKVLTGICYVGELTPKSKDYVVSFGERLSAPIVWGAIKDKGFEAQWFTGKEAGIVTDSNFGEADPLMNYHHSSHPRTSCTTAGKKRYPRCNWIYCSKSRWHCHHRWAGWLRLYRHYFRGWFRC